jgi:hypothetical protein|eukprot:COSAG06_NODE_1482_length_9317_cov_8.315578_5_plen_78_part_00
MFCKLSTRDRHRVRPLAADADTVDADRCRCNNTRLRQRCESSLEPRDVAPGLELSHDALDRTLVRPLVAEHDVALLV